MDERITERRILLLKCMTLCCLYSIEVLVVGFYCNTRLLNLQSAEEKEKLSALRYANHDTQKFRIELKMEYK